MGTLQIKVTFSNWVIKGQFKKNYAQKCCGT